MRAPALGPRHAPPHRYHCNAAIVCSATTETPLCDALLHHDQRPHCTALHVPGHKVRRVPQGDPPHAPHPHTSEARGRPLYCSALSVPPHCSMTSLSSQVGNRHVQRMQHTGDAGLDILSTPTSCIAAAQDHAARVFGAQQTWFLVNGSTVGIHAALLATSHLGDCVILARNCHIAAYAGLTLSGGCSGTRVLRHHPHRRPPTVRAAGAGPPAGLRPCRAGVGRRRGPAVSTGRGQARGSGAAGVTHLLWRAERRRCHCARGACSRRTAHRGRGTRRTPESPPRPSPGAFCFGACLYPHTTSQSAIQAGADVVVQSTHKILGALTQASMLHRAPGSSVETTRLSAALATLQSSSPSYLLMGSLDAATAQVAHPDALQGALQAAAIARAGLRDVPGVTVLGQGDVQARCGQAACFAIDPLRVTVCVDRTVLDMDGMQVVSWLMVHRAYCRAADAGGTGCAVWSGCRNGHGDGAIVHDDVTCINTCQSRWLSVRLASGPHQQTATPSPAQFMPCAPSMPLRVLPAHNPL